MSNSDNCILEIEVESNFTKDYIKELKAVQNQEQLDRHVEKWKYLFSLKKVSFNVIKELLTSEKKQLDVLSKAKLGDTDAQNHLDVLMPPLLLLVSNLANKFNVSDGVAFFQLYNGNVIMMNKEGYWQVT